MAKAITPIEVLEADAAARYQALRSALGVHLQRLREERGWRQLDVAYHTRMDPATYRKLECGQGNPGLEVLARLEVAFGVHAGELLAPTAATPTRRGPGRPRRNALPSGVSEVRTVERATAPADLDAVLAAVRAQAPDAAVTVKGAPPTYARVDLTPAQEEALLSLLSTAGFTPMMDGDEAVPGAWIWRRDVAVGA